MMPYFIYKISPPRILEHIDTKERFQEARALVRSIRSTLEPQEVNSVRMIFAKDSAEAEKLLSAAREERVIGED